ncbi:hypothetical protein BDW62DRAFT_145115 [Aspergillus aurantiobrunneus]
MAATIPLSVAIYDNPGIMHWSLYIEAENSADKTVVHVIGARQRYFPQIRTPSDARNSTSLIELCPLCEIDATKIEAVKNIAYETPIRNDEADYSCQDFVLDVLERLERQLIVNRANSDYRRNKAALSAKRQSWQ